MLIYKLRIFKLRQIEQLATKIVNKITFKNTILLRVEKEAQQRAVKMFKGQINK